VTAPQFNTSGKDLHSSPNPQPPEGKRNMYLEETKEEGRYFITLDVFYKGSIFSHLL